MEIIKLIFFEHKNSFTLQIVNLDRLSVEQIKVLEDFCRVRRGIFDFEKERISIQKRLSQEDVEKLFQLLKIDVQFFEPQNIAKKKPEKSEKAARPKEPSAKITFGKYKGKSYSELPDNYLQWLAKNYNGSENENISNEIMRRTIG